MSLRDKAATGVAWSALHTWGSHALQLGVMLVLARLLTPRDFGLFAMAQVVLLLIQAFANQGIPEALVQGNRRDPIEWSTGLLAILAGSSGATVVLLLTADPISLLFKSPFLAPVLRWLAPSLMLQSAHSILHARMRWELDFARPAAAGIAGSLTSFVAGVPAALAGLGVWSLVIAAYSGLLVETALLLRATGGVPLTGFDRVIYGRLLRFGRFIVAGAVTTFLNRRTDDYLVGLFLGAEVLGVYSVAYRLLELTTTVSLRAVERVAFPLLSKLQDQPPLMSDAIRTSFRFTSLVAFPAFAGLALVAHDLVLVALGPRWLPAAVPIQILSLSGFALCATNVLPSAVRAAGHPQRALAISAVKGVVVTGAFAVAARWSLAAVSWVFTVGVYAVFPFFYLAVRKVAPISMGVYLSEAVRPLLATVLMVIAIQFVAFMIVPLSPWVRLSLLVSSGVVSYVLGVLLFARDHIRELHGRLRQLSRGDREMAG